MKCEVKTYGKLTCITILNSHSWTNETEIDRNMIKILKDRIYSHNFLYRIYTHHDQYNYNKIVNFFSFLSSRCTLIVNHYFFGSFIILSFENEKDFFRFHFLKEELKNLIKD